MEKGNGNGAAGGYVGKWDIEELGNVSAEFSDLILSSLPKDHI